MANANTSPGLVSRHVKMGRSRRALASLRDAAEASGVDPVLPDCIAVSIGCADVRFFTSTGAAIVRGVAGPFSLCQADEMIAAKLA